MSIHLASGEWPARTRVTPGEYGDINIEERPGPTDIRRTSK